jgi:hypothetical protein
MLVRCSDECAWSSLLIPVCSGGPRRSTALTYSFTYIHGFAHIHIAQHIHRNAVCQHIRKSTKRRQTKQYVHLVCQDRHHSRREVAQFQRYSLASACVHFCQDCLYNQL